MKYLFAILVIGGTVYEKPSQKLVTICDKNNVCIEQTVTASFE